MTADPHKPLREDVRLLGELLGDTLRAREGEALLGRVEEVRALAKRAHAGDAAAFEELADRLSDLPIESAVPIARAFAHFLTLANIAEQHHRVRRRRDYARDPAGGPQPGSAADAFARWRGGRQAGQFLRPHGMSIDSRGNLYVGEASTGQRVQKFALQRPAPK